MDSLDAKRWEQVQSIFAQAADLPAGGKRRFVEEHCAGDEQLAKSVLAMLAEDEREQALLDGNPGGTVAEVAEEALRSDHLRSLVERQIGPYRLLRVLGEGGMGIVYLAERTDIGGLVAIKLLRDAWLSPMRRERFVLEQQTLVKLNHPAIARLYDASTMEDGTPWFVMEYADGHPLTDFARARGADLRADLLLFRRMCEAVQYAHAHAVIHRDLKPSNVLVTAEGEVKLLDFGIAKQMSTEASGERTIAGLRLLTPGYAAPEQYSGGDVGGLHRRVLAGRPALRDADGTASDSEEAHAGRQPARPSALARAAGARHAAELSRRQWADVDVLCLTALQPDPQRRYQSVDAFIRDVSAYLDGRVLEARPNSFTYSAGKFVRRNRLALGSTAAALLLLIAGTVFFTVRLAGARNRAVAEAERTERIQHFMLDMLGNADEEAGPAHDLKVVTLLDRAGQGASALSSDPATQVELYQTVGAMYDRLGKYEKSEQMLLKALQRSRQEHGKNTDTEATLVQLGTVRGDRGEVKEAQQNIQEALDRAAATAYRRTIQRSSRQRSPWGRIDEQSGEFQKAIDLLTPLTQMSPRSGGITPFDLRDSVATLAVAEQEAQHYAIAETMSQRAIELDRQLLGEDHVQTAVDLVNLASLHARQGDLPGAERLYREGLPIMKEWYGADHPDVATSSSFLAHILVIEKKYGEAEPILRQVLQIQEKAYGAVHERIAFTLNALGDIATATGALSEAEADYTRALAIDHALFGDASSRTALIRSNLGAVYLKQSRNVLAETTLRQAVEALKAVPPGNNMIGVARGRWGRALLVLKRYPEAEEQLNAAHELLKAQRTPPPTEVANVRADLVKLYLATHHPDKAQPYQAELAAGNAPPRG